MTPLEHFEMRNLNVGSTRISGYAYKGLMTFRFDTFAPLFSGGKELWAILILRNEVLFPTVPVFRNIDDAAGAIWDLSTVLSWERPCTRTNLRAASQSIAQILIHYHAFQFDHIFEAVVPEYERHKHMIPIPEGPIQ